MGSYMRTFSDILEVEKMKKILLLLLTLSLLIAGCGQADTTGDTGKLNAVSTIGMVNDLVKNIGGEHIEAVGLMGPGVDPHLYKASAGDVEKLQSADIIFYNGLHLEAKMGEVLEKMSEQRKVVAVTDTIDKETLLDSPDYEDQFDPHVWFDVTMWTKSAEVVRDSLIEADPEHKADYEANAAAFIEKMEALHTDVDTKTKTVPEGQRVLVTAHDAFSYFGQKYGFEVKGLQGISTESEAGTKDVADLADFIAERKIKAVFVESSVPRRNVEALQEAVAARDWEVTIGGELFSDAMGDEGTVEGTYLGMVTHNVDTIVGALNGEAGSTGEAHD